MKQEYKLISIMIIILLTFGCKGKDNEYKIVDGKKIKIVRESNQLKDNFTIAPRGDIYTEIAAHNYINSGDILDIVGTKIADKASEQEVKVDLTALKDKREITEAKIDAFNAVFDIKKTKNDSILYDVNVKKQILKGGSIYQVLTDLGMKSKDIGFYAWELGQYIDATSIDIGDTLIVDYYVDSLNVKKFNKFSYKGDKITIHEFFILGERELEYNKIVLPFELKRRFLTGTVTKEYPSLDQAMGKLGLEAFIRQQVNDAMESQLDLNSDARKGDTFEVYIEDRWIAGVREPKGKVLFTKYIGKRTGKKSAYRFVDDDDASAFNGMYTEVGKGLVQGAVRTPLNSMHITSPYGYRIHPILGRKILHKGIDYRGSTGTNVYAVSPGTIIKATDSGNGYGKEVQIRHANGMVTQYAHLSRIKTRYGRKVGKGAVIGLVGTTGRSTGPHLHFGVQLKGRWVNPRKNLRMVAALKLKGQKKDKFLGQVTKLNSKIRLAKQEKIQEKIRQDSLLANQVNSQ